MENLRILFGFSYHSHNLTCPASQGTATVGSRKLSATPDMSIQQLSQISWSFNGYKNRLFLAFSDMPCCWWMWVYDGLSMFIHWIPVKWRWILASKVAIPHPNDDPSTDQIVSWREMHQAPHEKAQRSSHRPAPKFAPIVSSGSISQTKVTSCQEGNIKSGSTYPLRKKKTAVSYILWKWVEFLGTILMGSLWVIPTSNIIFDLISIQQVMVGVFPVDPLIL